MIARLLVDFSALHSLKFVRGVRDFFSMQHHLEHVSMGIIDTQKLNHVVYSNSDHLIIDLLLYTDVCSLGLDFMYEPYSQYQVRALPIDGCEPFLQIGYVIERERSLSKQARWISVKHFNGEGGCCGGGSSVKVKRKKLKQIVKQRTSIIPFIDE